MRAKLNTINPISARSRRPAAVETSIASRSWRASVGSSTGVLPRRTLWDGPRTEAAGLRGTTWPTTSQSNRWRIAARCCLAVGADRAQGQAFDVAGDVERLDCADRLHSPALAPRQECGDGPGIGPPGVRVADVGGEELKKANLRPLAGGGDEDGKRFGDRRCSERVHVRAPVARCTRSKTRRASSIARNCGVGSRAGDQLEKPRLRQN